MNRGSWDTFWKRRRRGDLKGVRKCLLQYKDQDLSDVMRVGS